MVSGVSSIGFRGHGTESTGSIARSNQPSTSPECGRQLSFRGEYDYYERKKRPSFGAVALGLVGTAAVGVAGLGYAHKSNAFSKLSKDWLRKSVGKLEPFAEKCHTWCSKLKKTYNEYWTKLKNVFSSDKS